MTSEEPNNVVSSLIVTTNSSNIKTTTKSQRSFISESSTISDNTSDFIEIVKRNEVIYNNHHPDYKNVEVKAKIWSQIADEIGLSVDASKRKWKNLRDSYTKYLRSFRVGTKTAKKYQFWAHADHMDFLKPYQGVGRTSINIPSNKNNEEDNECDLGYQVLAKATASTIDEEQKQNPVLNSTTISLPITSTALTNMLPNFTAGTGGINATTTTGIGLSTMPTVSGITGSTTSSSTIILPVPSLPTVHLPPSLTAKPILGDLHTANNSTSSSFSLSTSSSLTGAMSSSVNTYTTPSSSLASLTPTSLASQVFTLPQLSAKGPLLMPSSNTASSVGCLIIEPQLFASADTFRKEFGGASTVTSSSSSNAQITPSGLQIYPSHLNGPSTTANASQALNNRLNPPLITKIRRVQPSPQASAINLSISTIPSTTAATSNSTLLSSYKANSGFNTNNSTNFVPTLGGSTTITATNGITAASAASVPPPPIKKPKTSAEVDIAAILQANRDLDANTLFFLSLARSVRNMPTKFQSLAKMRCMRIVSDIEMELDNMNDDGSGQNTKYCSNSFDSPPPPLSNNLNDAQSEHFVYEMSPSRVESMIDLSSDEENPHNNAN